MSRVAGIIAKPASVAKALVPADGNASYSGHFIQLSEPSLVIRQILTVVHAVHRHQERRPDTRIDGACVRGYHDRPAAARRDGLQLRHREPRVV